MRAKQAEWTKANTVTILWERETLVRRHHFLGILLGATMRSLSKRALSILLKLI